MTTETACSRCGKDPAEGWAFINDERHCHGDSTPLSLPTCYELATCEDILGRAAAKAADAPASVRDEMTRDFGEESGTLVNRWLDGLDS